MGVRALAKVNEDDVEWDSVNERSFGSCAVDYVTYCSGEADYVTYCSGEVDCVIYCSDGAEDFCS